MTTLRQKQWPEFKSFTIEENGLQLEAKQDNEFINVLIDFDDIGIKEVIVNKKPNPYGIIAYVSIFINVLFLVGYVADNLESSTGVLGGVSSGLVIGFSFWARELFKFTKLKIIQGPQSVAFFYNKREKERVDSFISDLQAKKVKFLRNKYMKVDRYTPREQLKSQFIWLRENNYINDDEIEVLMEGLSNRKLIDGE